MKKLWLLLFISLIPMLAFGVVKFQDPIDSRTQTNARLIQADSTTALMINKLNGDNLAIFDTVNSSSTILGDIYLGSAGLRLTTLGSQPTFAVSTGDKFIVVSIGSSEYLALETSGDISLMGSASGNVGVATTTPPSKFTVGSQANATFEFTQIDAENTVPVATACDSVNESGKMVLVFGLNRLYICNYASSSPRGWDYVGLTD